MIRQFLNWATVLLTTLLLSGVANAQTADQIMNRARDLYAGLQSYSDTGVVDVEYGRGSHDRHTFTTLFSRTPRGFLLDFHKAGGDRFVIWGDPDAFHSWYKTTGVQDDYPNPSNTGVFTMAGVQTKGVSSKIAPLLYSKASLPTDLQNLTHLTLQGTEQVGGHRCAKIEGRASDTYGATGREVNVRTVTVWVDAESFLIRKVLEVPQEQLAGQHTATTTTYEPQANPPVDQSKFRLVKSAGQ